MDSEGKDEDGAEQNKGTDSERQSVTMTRDQIEQIRDEDQQFMAEENLAKNDDLKSKATKGHVSLHLPPRPLDDLRPQDRVNVADLASPPNTVLFGKYLLCQTISPAMNMGAFIVSVTDPQGSNSVGGMRLALYNYSNIQKSVLNVALDEILPLGSFLVVKDPLLKATAEGSLMWTSENPADVEMVSRKWVEAKFPDLEWDDESEKTQAVIFQRQHFWRKFEGDEAAFAKLKVFGNKGFVDKRFSDAVRFFNMALDYCGENRDDEAMIQSNKSAALFGVGCFNAALKCAEAALEVDPGNEKFNYNKAKALIELRKYEEARSFLEQKFAKFSSLRKSKDCKKLLENVKFLCSRKNLGPTDSQLISLHMKNLEDEDKIPEFTGPLALLPQMEGKGRGLVATEDIRPGQLLICAKAFAIQATPPSNSKLTAINEIMAKFNQMDLGLGNNSAAVDKPSCHEEAVKEIANKLLFDPELGSELYKLSAGSDLGHLEHGDPKIRHVDMKRINEILRINAFGSERLEGDNTVEFTGLWILPAFFNHSCSEYNCVWAICGQWMTVRAIAEIKKGEELTLAYKSPIINYEERHNYFSSLGFTCSCKLCQLEAKESNSVKTQRQNILQSVDKLASKCGHLQIKLAMKQVEKLVSLRKENVALNFPLLSPQIVRFAKALFCNNRFMDCIAVLNQMYDVASASVRWHDDGIYVATNLIGCHAVRKERTLTKMWIANVKRLMKKCYGNLELMRVKESATVTLLQKQLGLDFFQDE